MWSIVETIFKEMHLRAEDHRLSTLKYFKKTFQAAYK